MKQPIIWAVQFNDGTIVREIGQDGEETVFDTEFLKRKSEFRYIALLDVVNDLKYSIDLDTGKFILRGQNFGVSKEIDGRVYDITTADGIDFRSGVIQFKWSKPMVLRAGISEPIKASPRMFNIGYKVDIPEKFCTYKRGEGMATIVKCQALLSIDSDTLQPSISTTWTTKTVTKDGEYFIKQ